MRQLLTATLLGLTCAGAADAQICHAAAANPAAGLGTESSRKIRTEIQEVCESGDLAVFRVAWVVDYTAPDGTVTTTRERDMEVWRRDGGRWRLARGMSLPKQ